MQATEQWTRTEESLGADWDEARLSFSVEDPGTIGAAAAVLAPLGPGRSGTELRFQIHRKGGGPDKLRNLLRRLDSKRIWGMLTLVDSRTETPMAAPAVKQDDGVSVSLVPSWDAELAKLPPGWRDLLCELELGSTDYLPRATLLGAPLNPARIPGEIALRFRVSAGGGYGSYGAPPGMVRRCLERMERDGITGHVRVVNVLSDTGYEATQGPVWKIAGRAV